MLYLKVFYFLFFRDSLFSMTGIFYLFISSISLFNWIVYDIIGDICIIINVWVGYFGMYSIWYYDIIWYIIIYLFIRIFWSYWIFWFWYFMIKKKGSYYDILWIIENIWVVMLFTRVWDNLYFVKIVELIFIIIFL